ncbi:MAG TPA: mannosyltransferase family protein, partial [Solirubrobacteraceae bacterium]|nr:mannosyltransferase family protein [Solirubrobacteraceae bacterium]
MEAHTRDLVPRRPASATATATATATRFGPLRPRLPREPAARAAAIGLALTLAVVLTGGLGAYLTFGPVPHGGFDPAGLVDHLGAGRDALVAPFARWDSVWYLAIARDGYTDGGAGTAFFPLYPLLVALVAQLGPGVLGAGVLVSVACLFVALRLLWRLTELELGGAHPQAARLTVLATALGPMAFFLTAIYSESLFLALSVGAFLAARQGRWAQAAGLGALGAATRSQGILLMGALALLYVEQRRGAPVRR